MPDGKDYYEVLGVDREAGTDEIKRAYRKLAREFHPDINSDPGAEAHFKAIVEANDVLSDPELRKKYDTFGEDFRQIPDDVDPEAWAQAQRMRDTAGRPPPDDAHGGGASYSMDDEAFQDLLSDLFGQQHRPGGGFGAVPGADQRASISLSLRDAFGGGEHTLTFDGPAGERTVRTNFPPGVTNGQVIRVPGKGGGGTQGAPAGDLYLHITVDEDPRFRLDGRDIEVELPLAPWEAALGTTVEVSGPGGTKKIRIAPGTSSGKRLRIKGQGMPTPGKPGDLYARTTIVVPTDLSDDERRLYSELADLSDFDPRSAA
ncbi:MAG: DnaJ C-terminal domain-containing protein [Microthrixaceae bacterium]